MIALVPPVAAMGGMPPTITVRRRTGDATAEPGEIGQELIRNFRQDALGLSSRAPARSRLRS